MCESDSLIAFDELHKKNVDEQRIADDFISGANVKDLSRGIV